LTSNYRQSKSNSGYGGLHLFKHLAVGSRDLFQAEKKVNVAKAEQIKKMTTFSTKNDNF
jgi:hypothetical protein